MMRREKVEGLILSRRNAGESDRLVTIFTQEQGLLRVVAKGVRKIPSRRGGHLEPFTRVLAVINRGRTSRYMVAVETLDYLPDLRRSEGALNHARVLAAIVFSLFEQEETQPRLYDAVRHAWEILPQLAAPKRTLLETAIAFYALRLAGLMPQLHACQSCGVRMPSEAVILDAQEGGWHCLLCHARLQGTAHSLSPHLLDVLRSLAAHPERALHIALSEDGSSQLQAAVRQYLSSATGQPFTAELQRVSLPYRADV